MSNYETEQLSALLEHLIDQCGHKTDKLIQGLIENLTEYFVGEDAQQEGNKIFLINLDYDFQFKKIGVIEIYEEGDIQGSFPSQRIEALKQYKKDNYLEFAFLIAFNTNNHILIREVDDNKINFLDLDYNT